MPRSEAARRGKSDGCRTAGWHINEGLHISGRRAQYGDKDCGSEGCLSGKADLKGGQYASAQRTRLPHGHASEQNGVRAITECSKESGTALILALQERNPGIYTADGNVITDEAFGRLR